MIFVNNIDPVLLSVGPIDIRWYGVLFALGILGAYSLINKAWKDNGWKQKELDSLILYLFLGVVIGARLGHIIFYRLEYFLNNPWEILMIWHGGLASHGAAIGLFLAYFLWCRKWGRRFFERVDAVALGIPVAAMSVRIANFLNSEIIGVPTDGTWGVVFSRLGEDFPRHPAMLYEAVLNLVILVLFLILYRRRGLKFRPGFYLGLYMTLYFGGRIITEIWKARLGTPETFPLSMGQILSIVGAFLGILVLTRKKRN